MTSEEKRQFTARISQANKSELVVILFEMFDYCIEQAEDGFKTEDLQKADSYLKSAKGCVSELRGSLDMGYEISHNLYRIYTNENRHLTASIIKRKPVNIDSVKENMEKLRKSFEEVAKQDTSGSVVQNSQKVYAGLTYGKGTLNEVFMDNEAARGFKA